jgi:rhamnose transport system permease protein
MRTHRRELTIAAALGVLCVVLAAAAPEFFTRANLSDLFLGNAPVLLVAMGATLVILTGEIDISVGSVFAICGVVSGLTALAGAPLPVVVAATCATGAALGALNGVLVAYARLPSIVVTLATMVALRDGLRWWMQGAWVQGLPESFQWLGLSQATYPFAILLLAALLQAGFSFGAGHVAAGRAVYATGSDADSARLAGIDTARVKFAAFTVGGALTGLAALVNDVRFNQIPSNAGIGLEMRVIAAVVLGGAAVRGGRGTFTGTLLGVALLAIVGPALVFLGVTSYWERALHGVIILVAVAADAWGARRARSIANLAVAHP